jgi:hypothetical protein
MPSSVSRALCSSMWYDGSHLPRRFSGRDQVPVIDFAVYRGTFVLRMRSDSIGNDHRPVTTNLIPNSSKARRCFGEPSATNRRTCKTATHLRVVIIVPQHSHSAPILPRTEWPCHYGFETALISPVRSSLLSLHSCYDPAVTQTGLVIVCHASLFKCECGQIALGKKKKRSD